MNHITVLFLSTLLFLLNILQCSSVVTSVDVQASPTSYAGLCSRVFVFSATITSDSAGTVEYAWKRNTGSIGPTKSITFTDAGTQTVTDSWSLGIGLPSPFNGWEQVQISSPNNLNSTQGNFTLSCITATVNATVTPTTWIGCPKTFSFSADITATGAGIVYYAWERNNGAIGPTQSTTFGSAGTRTVTDSFHLGFGITSYSGWEQVRIINPSNPCWCYGIVSNQATFTLNC